MSGRIGPQTNAEGTCPPRPDPRPASPLTSTPVTQTPAPHRPSLAVRLLAIPQPDNMRFKDSSPCNGRSEAAFSGGGKVQWVTWIAVTLITLEDVSRAFQARLSCGFCGERISTMVAFILPGDVKAVSHPVLSRQGTRTL